MANNKQSFILSSLGLKNIVNDQREFRFIINQKEILMNHVHSEFISPLVSHVHHSDPTIDKLSIEYKPPIKEEYEYFDKVLSEDIIQLIQALSTGNEIEINDEQSKKMRVVSLILQNEELFKKINEIYPLDTNDIKNIDEIFYLIEIHENLSQINKGFDQEFSSLIDHISIQFYQLNQLKRAKLQSLSKQILYKIISNGHLRIESEDSLFDFIEEYFNNNRHNDDDGDVIDKIKFYEQIDIKNLSEEKFKSLLLNLDPNSITGILWQNLLRRLVSKDDDNDEANERVVKKSGGAKRHSLGNIKQVNFDGQTENRLNGIIRQLTNECGGNVHEKGVVIVTASSEYGDSCRLAKNAVDLDDKESRFASQNEANSWLRYDLKERKIRPTHYTIRSKNHGTGDWHPQHWVIEGSNSGSDDDWRILDTRNNISVLNGAYITHTFEIQEEMKDNEFYRYLRIRQTGLNARNHNVFAFSALEYFGSIISNQTNK